MDNLRHFEARLRWSERRPYVIARSFIAAAAASLLVLFVFSVLQSV